MLINQVSHCFTHNNVLNWILYRLPSSKLRFQQWSALLLGYQLRISHSYSTQLSSRKVDSSSPLTNSHLLALSSCSLSDKGDWWIFLSHKIVFLSPEIGIIYSLCTQKIHQRKLFSNKTPNVQHTTIGKAECNHHWSSLNSQLSQPVVRNCHF